MKSSCCLLPALPPGVVFNRGWRVVGAFMVGNDTVLELLADGCVLGACTHAVGADAPEPYIVAEHLEGVITGAYRCSDGYMVLTTAGMYRVVFDSGTVMLKCEVAIDATEYPPVGITVASETSMTLPVAGFKLSGSYDASSVRLAADDAAKLARVLGEAYSRGCADATGSGQFIAPVLARYRLFDSRGELLYESAPKLMVPTGRHDRTMTTTLGVDSFTRVGAGGVAVPLYGLGISLPRGEPGVAGERVARLEVQLTPQLHCVDAALSSTHRLQLARNETTLTATMPGCDPSGKGTGRFRRVVLGAVAACDSLFETVLTVEKPFARDAEARVLPVGAIARTLDEELEAVGRAAESSTALWIDRCRVPHAVSGTVGRRDGEVTLLGNLSVGLFGGHRVEYYSNHGTELDDVETVAAVKFADGRRAVCGGGGHTWRGMMLSPLIAYPDREARSIELQMLDSAGCNHRVSLPLVPCGRFACYLDESVWPVALDDSEEEFYLPVDTRETIRYPGNIVAFAGDRPGADLSGREIGHGQLNVIVPVGQPSSSAWESSRSRFNVMGSDGIFSLAMNGGRLVTPVRLDSRPVMRTDAVATVTGEASGSRVWAIAGRDLVSVEGNRVRTVARDIDAEMLVWNRRGAELMAVTAPGLGGAGSSALVMHSEGSGWSTRSLPPVSAVYSGVLAARLTSEVEGMVYDPEREVESAVRCRYVMEVKQPAGHVVRGVPFISEFTVDLTAGSVDGTVTVAGDHGRGPARVLSRLTVTGELNRPLAHHVMMPSRRRVTVAVDAMLSPDARLGDITVYYTGSKK